VFCKLISLCFGEKYPNLGLVIKFLFKTEPKNKVTYNYLADKKNKYWNFK